jgi:hypothetical protein
MTIDVAGVDDAPALAGVRIAAADDLTRRFGSTAMLIR